MHGERARAREHGKAECSEHIVYAALTRGASGTRGASSRSPTCPGSVCEISISLRREVLLLAPRASTLIESQSVSQSVRRSDAVRAHRYASRAVRKREKSSRASLALSPPFALSLSLSFPFCFTDRGGRQPCVEITAGSPTSPPRRGDARPRPVRAPREILRFHASDRQRHARHTGTLNYKVTVGNVTR